MSSQQRSSYPPAAFGEDNTPSTRVSKSRTGSESPVHVAHPSATSSLQTTSVSQLFQSMSGSSRVVNLNDDERTVVAEGSKAAGKAPEVRSRKPSSQATTRETSPVRTSAPEVAHTERTRYPIRELRPAPAPAPDPDDAQAQDFLRALTTAIASASASGSGMRLRPPDVFDGSDPKKLRSFLVQCENYFRAKPAHFTKNSDRVIFAISYLQGTPAQFFDEIEDRVLHDWPRFTRRLLAAFGPFDAIADAERELRDLRMSPDQPIRKYLMDFLERERLLSDWGEKALRAHFYEGLLPRIKDAMARDGKPDTLSGMKLNASVYDERYWAREAEKARDRRASGQSKTPNTTTSGNSSNNQSSSGTGNRKDKKQSNSSSSSAASSAATSTSPPSASSAGSSKPLDLKLRKDGKLTPEERQRRREKGLCMFCGLKGHLAKDCKKAAASASAKGRSAQAGSSSEESKA